MVFEIIPDYRGLLTGVGIILICSTLHGIVGNILADAVQFVFIADYMFVIIALPYCRGEKFFALTFALILSMSPPITRQLVASDCNKTNKKKLPPANSSEA
ncbi:MAG: hypothetical protein HGB36_10410 [Chlorobiaceae bacterium]|nr:hypothetical protein [Chlorobiaceae bacterium]